MQPSSQIDCSRPKWKNLSCFFQLKTISFFWFFSWKKSLVFFVTFFDQFFLVFSMEKNQKKLIKKSYKKQLRFFHMVREQSICGLGCKHSSFGILSHEVSTDRMKSVCIKTKNLLSLYRYKTTILAYKKSDTLYVVEKSVIWW